VQEEEKNNRTLNDEGRKLAISYVRTAVSSASAGSANPRNADTLQWLRNDEDTAISRNRLFLTDVYVTRYSFSTKFLDEKRRRESRRPQSGLMLKPDVYYETRGVMLRASLPRVPSTCRPPYLHGRTLGRLPSSRSLARDVVLEQSTFWQSHTSECRRYGIRAGVPVEQR
jgi:hypothetical protein